MEVLTNSNLISIFYRVIALLTLTLADPTFAGVGKRIDKHNLEC